MWLVENVKYSCGSLCSFHYISVGQRWLRKHSVQDHTIVSADKTVGDDVSFSGLLFIHLCKGQWKQDNPVSTQVV